MARLPADEDYARALLSIFGGAQGEGAPVAPPGSEAKADFLCRNFGRIADFEAALQYATSRGGLPWRSTWSGSPSRAPTKCDRSGNSRNRRGRRLFRQRSATAQEFVVRYARRQWPANRRGPWRSEGRSRQSPPAKGRQSAIGTRLRQSARARSAASRHLGLGVHPSVHPQLFAGNGGHAIRARKPTVLEPLVRGDRPSASRRRSSVRALAPRPPPASAAPGPTAPDRR